MAFDPTRWSVVAVTCPLVTANDQSMAGRTRNSAQAGAARAGCQSRRIISESESLQNNHGQDHLLVLGHGPQSAIPTTTSTRRAGSGLVTA